LYHCVPYNIDIEVDTTAATEVTAEETATMRRTAASLNPSHALHIKTNGATMPKVECQTVVPANNPAEDAAAAGMPVGAVKGWCSWCFGVPNGRSHQMAERQGGCTKSWMVPKLKSPFTPKEGKIGKKDKKAKDEEEGDEEGEEGGEEEDEEEEMSAEVEVDFDAGDLSLDIVPSLEDTIDLLAKLGKNLAKGDRPKTIIDKLKRVPYKCTNCTREVIKCAHADCDEESEKGQGFARFTAYNAECYCFKHVRMMQEGSSNPPEDFTGGFVAKASWKVKMAVIKKLTVTGGKEFKDWGDVPEVVRGKEGHCSWCFDKTTHSLSLPLPGKPTLLKCGGCNLQTQACKKKGCEDYGIGGQKFCAVHALNAKPGWEDSDKQEYLDSQKLERFCSWCMNQVSRPQVLFTAS
jgi:hypothetical protein